MKSCFSTASTLLAAVCAFLFAIVTALILFTFIAERTLFSAGTYKQALRSQQVFDHMPALIAEQIIYQEQHATPGEGLAPELQRLTQADWEIMLADILTPAALRTQAESVIDQFFTYIDNPSKSLELKVSLVDFKQKLEGEEGYRATLDMIDAQPACTSQEWADIVSKAQSAQFQDIPFCRPTSDELATAEPYIRTALHDLAAAIPNEIYLDSSLASAGSLDRLDEWRVQLQRLRRWVGLSLCLPLILLVLTAVFGVRSLASGGIWLGIPLAAAGLLTLIAALFTWSLPIWRITRYTPNGPVTVRQIEGVAPGVFQALGGVATSIVHSMAGTISIVGLLLVLVGGGLLAAGLLFGYVWRRL